LLAQGEVLESDLAMTADEEGEEPEQVKYESDHVRRLWPTGADRSTTCRADGVLARDRGPQINHLAGGRGFGDGQGGGLGGFIGPFLGGWLFDVTGSYRIAFVVAALAIAASGVAAWVAAPRRARAARRATSRIGP
jgi:hypothetical protein